MQHMRPDWFAMIICINACRKYEYNSQGRYDDKHDDDDAALQVALAESLAPFELEDILRTTAEPLPLRAQDGFGVIWQSKQIRAFLCFH